MAIDLIQVIEQIGREKGIERDVLIEAVGAAILSASRKSLGPALDLQIAFDDKTAKFRLYKVRQIVEEVANPLVEMSLAEALARDPAAQLGGEIRDELETAGFGRIAAQTAKQVIIQRVREAERDTVYQAFKGREGDLVSGYVQRVVKGNVIVGLGKAEAVLPAREQIPREDYRPGDRVRAYVVEVKKTPKGSQIVLSRTHPALLAKLFEVEVPEISEGIVEIKAAAREPGERSKIAVASRDPNVDPVGACVGYRGSRVQAVVKELLGEKVDIVPWRESPVEFVKNALAPAEVEVVTLHETEHALEVLVADDQLSLAIGKRGQNARLAAKLTGWKVDIHSRSEVAQLAGLPAPAEPSEVGSGAPDGVSERAGELEVARAGAPEAAPPDRLAGLAREALATERSSDGGRA
jgi:N utilization substance protein A